MGQAQLWLVLEQGESKAEPRGHSGSAHFPERESRGRPRDKIELGIFSRADIRYKIIEVRG